MVDISYLLRHHSCTLAQGSPLPPSSLESSLSKTRDIALCTDTPVLQRPLISPGIRPGFAATPPALIGSRTLLPDLPLISFHAGSRIPAAGFSSPAELPAWLISQKVSTASMLLPPGRGNRDYSSHLCPSFLAGGSSFRVCPWRQRRGPKVHKVGGGLELGLRLDVFLAPSPAHFAKVCCFSGTCCETSHAISQATLIITKPDSSHSTSPFSSFPLILEPTIFIPSDFISKQNTNCCPMTSLTSIAELDR